MIEVVAAVIFNSDNKILIGRRGANKSLAGKWEFPGGKIKPGETHRNALKRELKEELNIIIQVENLLGFNIHQYDDFAVHLYAYKTLYICGDFELTDHDSIKWVAFEELSNYDFAEADIPLIACCNPNKPLQ